MIEESDYHKHNIYFDIDGLDFYLEFLKKKDFFLLELKVLKEVLQNKCNAPTNVLNYKIKKKKPRFSLLNRWITYKILLTIYVILKFAKNNLSNLKLIKSYLRLTMLQERLSN